MRAAGLNPYIGFIEWAREQIENYAEMFRKQVYTSDVDPQTIEDAIKVTYLQSKRVCIYFPLNLLQTDNFGTHSY